MSTRIRAIIEPRMAAAARSGTGAIAVGVEVARVSEDTVGLLQG
jgi:hypothetical protein